MVLPRGIIEFSIINAHTPTNDRISRYNLISFILDNDHIPFLGNYLYRINPLTVRNGIDDSCIK